jgi:hypothetical protein
MGVETRIAVRLEPFVRLSKIRGENGLTAIGGGGGAEGWVDFRGVRSRVAERGGVRLCGLLGWLRLHGRLALGLALLLQLLQFVHGNALKDRSSRVRCLATRSSRSNCA